MVKNRIKRKTRGKTRRKTRGKTRGKHRRKIHTLRKKTKKKSRKRGGMLRATQGESKTQQGESKTQQGESKTQQVMGSMGALAEHLQHAILQYEYPGVATGMYTNSPQRRDLNRRMGVMTRFTQAVRDRLTTQVGLPGVPVGTLVRADNIHQIMLSRNLNEAQDKEVRRLVARLYANANPADGYRDRWIFGTGPFNSKTAAHVGTHAERKQQRQALLANGNINDMKINGESLPLPLKILRKNRRFNQQPSPRYPRNDDGSVDETHDVFWPRNRVEFDFYMKTFPTLNEIGIYGW